ncbi:PucR family transcriptional regulator [Amphibacillus cookii]|uniref:PucR family transcriptional regulator n=1 Tax=Amphibacillus cookii TaxID=767787 RepID=UPI00195E134E|nr:PucR family transcriptional regulator [Amphibacillus cookii]MBM7541556.1 purine catabolism regulator [Amphibacillus cookii]
MAVSIESILNMEAFADVRIIAGDEGISRQVQSVYVMEVPDIFSYIDQDGLLFTTLYPIADNEKAMQSFIAELSKHQLAGVAIKLGRYITEVPHYMIDQANQLQFPILVLPQDANLSTLTNHILTTLLGMKTSMLEFRETISQQLHRLLLQGASMETFVQYVSQITDGSIMILDNSLSCKASSFNRNENPLLINKDHFQLLIDSATLSEANQEVLMVGNEWYHVNQLFIQAISAGSKSLGYLVMIIDTPDKVSKHLHVIVEQAIILLAFLLQTEQTIIQKERHYLDSFIRDIMNGRYQSQSEVIEKAKVFRWNFNFPNVILLLKTDIEDSSSRLSAYYKILDSDKIAQLVADIFDVPMQNCKVIYYNDELLCFVSVAFETRLKERLRRLGDSLVKSLSGICPIAVSISDTIYQISGVKTAYEHASLVHHIHGSSLESRSFVQFYDELGLYKLFHLIKDQDRLNEYIQDKIGKVIEYDQQREINLLETLNYLIKNKGNLQKTADDMYIHYNSLRYRVNKIKELGLALEDGLAFSEIGVACQLYQYLLTQRNNQIDYKKWLSK